MAVEGNTAPKLGRVEIRYSDPDFSDEDRERATVAHWRTVRERGCPHPSLTFDRAAVLLTFCPRCDPAGGDNLGG